MTNKFGFVYVVTNHLTGKKYLGRKNYRYANGRKTGWETYMGSCKTLLHDIHQHGIHNFSRTIITECETKQELCELEERLQREHDVLHAVSASGERLWYNENIGGKKFYSKIGWHHTIKTKQKLSQIKRGLSQSPEYIASLTPIARARAVKLVNEGKHHFLGGAIQRRSSLLLAAQGKLPSQLNPPRGLKNGGCAGKFRFTHPVHGTHETYARDLCKNIFPYLGLDNSLLASLATGTYKPKKGNYRGWTATQLTTSN